MGSSRCRILFVDGMRVSIHSRLRYPAAMRLRDIIDELEKIAPAGLAEPWDAVGLHVGDMQRDVKRAMLCIDLTEAVLAEAVGKKASLIVAYHPPIFKPLKAVTSEDDKARLILRAIEHGLAVYSPHTSLDAAEGGVNDWLSQGVGEGEVRPIRPTAAGKQYKLIVFVPAEHADRLRQALAEAGAGQIGDYSHCTFSLEGQGTFLGGPATHPTIGEPGRLERVSELRMETVCPEHRLAAVLQQLEHVHPYEEPAFDVVPLAVPPSHRATTGQGRIVILKRPVSLRLLVQRVKRHLNVSTLEVAAPGRSRPISRVAVCAGAGGSLLAEAGEIDTFITGEMRHHDVLTAQQCGIAVLLAGHTQTERPYLPTLRRRLTARLGTSVQWHISRRDRPPATSR
jgi:dinuclear metal center YbgI/SA1388 family protein